MRSDLSGSYIIITLVFIRVISVFNIRYINYITHKGGYRGELCSTVQDVAQVVTGGIVELLKPRSASWCRAFDDGAFLICTVPSIANGVL